MDNSIAYFNCNGIINKWAELSNCIPNFDTFGMSETKLEPGDFTPYLKNYHCIRKDRDGCQKEHGERLIVFVNKCYQYESLPFAHSPKNFEFIYLKIFNDKSSIFILFCYNPPYNILKPIDFINTFIDFANYRETLSLGDFNAQNALWGSSKLNQLGNNFGNALALLGFLQLLNDNKPTRIHSLNSCLDLALCSTDFSHQLSFQVLDNNMGSNPIVISFNSFTIFIYFYSLLFIFTNLH